MAVPHMGRPFRVFLLGDSLQFSIYVNRRIVGDPGYRSSSRGCKDVVET